MRSLLLLLLAAWPATAQVLPPRFVEFVRTEGEGYGLSLAGDRVFLLRRDPVAGAFKKQPLRPRQVLNLLDFVLCHHPKGHEAAAADALRSYLLGTEGSMDGDAYAELIESLPGGRERLTARGRLVLIDLLTAEDGTLWKEPEGFARRIVDAGMRSRRAAEARALKIKTTWGGGRLESALAGRAAASELAVEPRQDAQGYATRRKLLDLEGLIAAGMTGQGGRAAVLDTGIDDRHPDFQGRITDLQDMTGAGHGDKHGHGTHVAGLLAGSGRDSGFLFRGAAPRAELQVYKVDPGDDDSAQTPPDESLPPEVDDHIVRALLDVASKPEGERPHVLNLSLSGGHTARDNVTPVAERVMLKRNVLVVTVAGNGRFEKNAIESPGHSPVLLTMTGTDRGGAFTGGYGVGPVEGPGGVAILKPDLSAVAGSPADGVPGPRSARSLSPAIAGHPGYTQMSGTSQTAPFAAGAATAVAGWLERMGRRWDAIAAKAALLEAAKPLQAAPERAGAGMLDGGRLADLVRERAQVCAPIGNVAHMLALRLTSRQREAVDASKRWERTRYGVRNKANGRVIGSDAELVRLVRALQSPQSAPERKAASPEQDAAERLRLLRQLRELDISPR